MDDRIRLYNGDCLEIMDELIKKGLKVDAIITDPPYGTTACKWDSVIPFDEMWERLNKLYNTGASCLLFGSEPFSTTMRISNFKNYRYDIYWVKSKAGLYQHAKNRPMKSIETISVFSPFKWGHKSQIKERMNYYPQGVVSSGHKTVKEGYHSKNLTGGRPNQIGVEYESFTGFPQ